MTKQIETASGICGMSCCHQPATQVIHRSVDGQDCEYHLCDKHSGSIPPQPDKATARPLDLTSFKEQFQIVCTKEDSKGNKFNDYGTLNAASWIGENAGLLITEIEMLRAEKSSGFDLKKLKAELYEEGRAEHAALMAVANKNQELELLASIIVEYHGTSEGLKAARKIRQIVTDNRNNLADVRGEKAVQP